MQAQSNFSKPEGLKMRNINQQIPHSGRSQHSFNFNQNQFGSTISHDHVYDTNNIQENFANNQSRFNNN